MDREQLRAIIEEETRLAGGVLQPEGLVKRARATAHPLHDTIWRDSDAKAAMAWRIDIARGLIRSVHIEVVGKTDPGVKVVVPLMVHAPKASGQSGFRTFTDIRSSPAQSYAALERELAALRGHYMRTMAIAEGLGLTDKAREGVASWDSLMGQLSARGVKVPVEASRKRAGEPAGARA